MRTATTTRQRLRKCHKPNQDDAFSRLHDEIIVSHILPRLTTDEAVRTSILSRRWKHLWIHGLGSKLLFSHTRDRYRTKPLLACRIRELRTMYAHGISHVLEAYPKASLDELVVNFDFCLSNSHAIDRWVEYALRKGVNRLELDLRPFGPFMEKYEFPTLQKLSAMHALCDTIHNEPVRCTGLFNLKDICFKGVDVSSEVIQFMLSNCLSLERLSVWNLLATERIIVSEQSVKLKSLEVVGLYTKIKISSSNLVSLLYSGNAKALRIKHAPLLSDLSIGEGYCKAFLRTCSQNFRYISQLRRLTLDMCNLVKEAGERSYYHLEFPQLAKLEQLEVKIGSYRDSYILWPIILVKAAPLLRRLSVQLRINPYLKQKKGLRRDQIMNLKIASRDVRHQCLQLIEICGFKGYYERERELVEHLFGISESLKEVVISSHHPQDFGKPRPIDDELAKQLKGWLPDGADLLVL